MGARATASLIGSVTALVIQIDIQSLFDYCYHFMIRKGKTS